MDLSLIKTKLQQNGVVGAGGAGFPSYAKLAKGADTIILNCAECEPLLTLHRQLLAEKAEEILHALSMVAKEIGITHCIVGVKAEYTQTVQALKRYADEYGVCIKELSSTYPMGDEVVLIYECTGRVVPAGGLPLQCGVIVSNVETVYNGYRALFFDEPVTHKLITVSAAVKNPKTVWMPLGSSLKEAVELCGGETVEDAVYIVGGPMMGVIANPLDPITKTTNAILVLPRDHQVVRSKLRRPEIDIRRAASACCQCHMCTDLCSRHMLGHPIDPSKFMNAVANRNLKNTDVYFNALYCSSCGLCESYACMQGLSPRLLLSVCKSSLRAEGVKPIVMKDCKPLPQRPGRLVPEERLESRLDLAKYQHPAPITPVNYQGKKLRIRYPWDEDWTTEIKD
ncbi:MAG: SLBB domain-containing protein [Clostridia bacterium]|nr:SLBB domain-containing protein [Clostridia bacterium]